MARPRRCVIADPGRLRGLVVTRRAAGRQLRRRNRNRNYQADLPENIAVRFPAGLDVVHEIHYVNSTDKTVEAWSHVNAYTMPGEQVEGGVWGGQARDEHIKIPPNSTHTE